MQREAIVLITGANGEVGHGLIEYFSAQADAPEIITLDLNPLDEKLRPLVKKSIVGNILDAELLDSLHRDYQIDTIFHLAALLSTTGEKKPDLAHKVNVEGTVKLLEMAIAEGQERGVAVKFIYPSSIAAYGLPDLATKAKAGRVAEDSFLQPSTMYGCNKLYCEHMGRYYANHYMQLSDETPVYIDFRAVRFPGLISAFTVPSGGTSDYGPEMIHAAAKGEAYECFVREDSIIPFMAMPDAIKALIDLAEAPREALSREVYNVTAFSLTAAEFAKHVKAEFPNADIRFKPSKGRQGIVDSWPADIEDAAARKDWGWSPEYGLERAFRNYLFPHIRERYKQAIGS
jgi:threonine 3-dehydrogenase